MGERAATSSGPERTRNNASCAVLYLQAANQVIFFISPPLIGIGAFLTYQYFYGDITVDKVIVVLAYTNLLRLPMAIMPRAIGQFIESLVSMTSSGKVLFFQEEVSERQPFATIDENDCVLLGR